MKITLRPLLHIIVLLLIASMGLAGCVHSSPSHLSTLQSSSNPLMAPQDQTYLFNTGSITVQNANLPAINAQANYLVQHNSAKVLLIGNTDNLGSPAYNVGIGWMRAKNIANLLTQQGVSPNQMMLLSYGAENASISASSNNNVNLIYKAY